MTRSSDDEWRAPGTPAPPSRVLTQAVTHGRQALDELLAVAPETLSDADLTRLLDHATASAARLAAVTSAAMAEADHRRLGDEIGARHVGQWWASRSHLTQAETGRQTKLARILATDLNQPIREAMGSGELHAEQAREIAHALAAIPDHIDDLPAFAESPAALKARARDQLLILAKDHDAKDLRRLGRRILDLVAPDIGEAAEAKALADEEAAAERSVHLTMREDDQGRCHGTFTIPTAAGQAFRKQLLAITGVDREKPDSDTPAADRQPLTTRMGWAFIEWIEGYPAGYLPTAGGTAATVVVTMSLESLLGGLATASLDTGTQISAGQARRLACEAGMVPAVLGGPSEVLDLGRTRRFHTKAQRLALALRDQGCTAEGCDLPPAACHAHHDIVRWSQGGTTDLDTGRLLCHRHHRVIHDPHYETTRLPNGQVRFHRRT